MKGFTLSVIPSSQTTEEAQINFTSFDAYVAAIKILDQSQISGKPFQRDLESKHYKFKPDTSVYANQLPSDVDSDTLAKVFSGCGTILVCQVMRDWEQKSKDYGLIDFASSEEASKAVQTMNNTQPFDTKQTIKVEHFRTKSLKKIDAQTNLCIKGLPVSFTEAQLKTLCSQFGEVRSIRLRQPNLNLYENQAKMELALHN